jgi:hypothetical protein
MEKLEIEVTFYQKVDDEFKEFLVKPKENVEQRTDDCSCNQPDEKITYSGLSLSTGKNRLDSVFTSKRVWEIKLVSIGNWPEIDNRTCYKHFDYPWPFHGGYDQPYPCVWTRECTKSYYIIIGFGGDVTPDIETAVKECGGAAITVAVPLLLTGQPALALGAFAESFKLCMITKGIEIVSQFTYGIEDRKDVITDWHKI